MNAKMVTNTDGTVAVYRLRTGMYTLYVAGYLAELESRTHYPSLTFDAKIWREPRVRLWLWLPL